MRLIDADALTAQLEDRQAFLAKEWGYRDHYTRGFEEAVDKVGNAPSVDAVPVVHGRWIETEGEVWHLCQRRTMIRFRCSQCEQTELKRSNFCPNCGAKMDLKKTLI